VQEFKALMALRCTVFFFVILSFVSHEKHTLRTHMPLHIKFKVTASFEGE